MSREDRSGWLFVLPWRPTAIGGVSRVVNELATSLSQGGSFAPHVLVLDWGAEEATYDRSNPSTVIRLRIRDRGAPWSRERLYYLLSLPWVTPMLRHMLSHLRISVVNAHYPTEQALELLARIRGIRPGVKTVVSFHGMDVARLGEVDDDVRRRWIGDLGLATAVTCCSAGLLARLESALDVQLPNAVVRHNGASRWKPAPARPAAGARRRSAVVSVGTYHVNKGHDVLIEAFARIAREHPQLDLMIVGRSGPELDNLHELVRARDLDHRIMLKTDMPPDDMAAIYDGAAMFVSASRFEPFGISILEAGAAGLPVIATDTDGARDILEDGTDSIVVPREDPAALAGAIASLAADPERRARLARALQARVHRDYQWDAIARSWEALAAGPSVS
jgi:glycosyltransferase involved in cell wall biosynthesis